MQTKISFWRRTVGILVIVLLVLFVLVGGLFFWNSSNLDDQGFKDFLGEVKVVQGDFQDFYRYKTDYPSYTLEQLQQMGARSDDDAQKEYWVYFVPFSSKTPDSKIVLRMGYGPLGCIPFFCDFNCTKGELIHDPEYVPNPLKDKLEVAKEIQALQFSAEHPNAKITSALAWLVGVRPGEDSKAAIQFEYCLPADSKEHKISQSLTWENSDWTIDPPSGK